MMGGLNGLDGVGRGEVGLGTWTWTWDLDLDLFLRLDGFQECLSGVMVLWIGLDWVGLDWRRVVGGGQY